MTISIDLAVSNSMSCFVPKYWLKLQILVAILMNFVDKGGTTKRYIPHYYIFIISQLWLTNYKLVCV